MSTRLKLSQDEHLDASALIDVLLDALMDVLLDGREADLRKAFGHPNTDILRAKLQRLREFHKQQADNRNV